MKLYGVGGLGADKRVYKALSLDCDFIFIDWIKPRMNESLKSYSSRLSVVIDSSEGFGLVGVSFGGLVVSELAKILNPKFVILISSVEVDKDLKGIYKLFGKTRINRILPISFYNLPRKVACYIFGTNSPLLTEILDDTDLSFVKWAVNQLLNWENKEKIKNVYRIHGMRDRLLLCPDKKESVFLIKDGGHFAVVDNGREVSEIINKITLLN